MENRNSAVLVLPAPDRQREVDGSLSLLQRPFAEVTNVSSSRSLSRSGFLSHSDAGILVKWLFASVTLVILLCAVYYFLVYRFADASFSVVPDLEEGLLSIGFLLTGLVYLLISSHLESVELCSLATQSLSPATPSRDDDIELESLGMTNRLPRDRRLLRLARNDIREQAQRRFSWGKWPQRPQWMQGEPDFSNLKDVISSRHRNFQERIVRLPSSMAFSDAWPLPLNELLPKERRSGSQHLLEAWAGSIDSPDFDFSLAEIGGVALAVVETDCGKAEMDFLQFLQYIKK
ncbi:MAG: hypothetical protein SGCHY_001516 [Lobulomycetales sp.]